MPLCRAWHACEHIDEILGSISVPINWPPLEWLVISRFISQPTEPRNVLWHHHRWMRWMRGVEAPNKIHAAQVLVLEWVESGERAKSLGRYSLCGVASKRWGRGHSLEWRLLVWLHTRRVVVDIIITHFKDYNTFS
jgi:hypothetical protein